jgi:hypothetical protein
MLAIELNCNELELAKPAIGNAMAGGNLLQWHYSIRCARLRSVAVL